MSRNPKPVYRIYTRPNSPFWQAWRYADNGSKERISTGLLMAEYTRDEALEIVNRLCMDIESEGEILNSPDNRDNRVHKTKSRTLTIEKFTRQLEMRLTKKGLAPGTISLYLSALDHLKCVYGREYDVKAINRAAIWKVQEYLMEQPGKAPGSKMSNAAINMNLRHLRGAFGYLVNDEILDRNPFARFEMMFESKRDYSFSNEELSRLFEIMGKSGRPNHVRIARILLYTGARVSEILQSHREDIDIHNWEWVLRNVKTRDKRTRRIVVPESIRGDVLYFLETRRDSDHPFAIVTANRLSILINGWLRDAGITGKKLHSFRHTFATRVVNDTEYNIRDAQLALGHSSIRITEGYVHDRAKPKPINIKIDI